LKETDFQGIFVPDNTVKGSTHWKSPSNLAIVKYWGKYGRQLPRNPSISITLSEAVTTTSIDYEVSSAISAMRMEFLFEGQANAPFAARIQKFLESITEFFPFLTSARLQINSSNSFPHSSGIASSASSMSALALCLCDIEKNLGQNDLLQDSGYFMKKASFISRLGSGSACRSVYPHFALWGAVDGDVQSSDLYAVPQPDFHSLYNGLRNDILIVSASEKSVSSTAGHQLMETNLYAQQRFNQANERVVQLKDILKAGDLEAFGEMLESEALTLHALMMASNPSYMLMEPNTIHVINELRSFRKSSGIPIYFSLDAGPNMHIISFEKDRPQVNSFLDSVRHYAVNGKIISDKIGVGAIRG